MVPRVHAPTLPCARGDEGGHVRVTLQVVQRTVWCHHPYISISVYWPRARCLDRIFGNLRVFRTRSLVSPNALEPSKLPISITCRVREAIEEKERRGGKVTIDVKRGTKLRPVPSSEARRRGDGERTIWGRIRAQEVYSIIISTVRIHERKTAGRGLNGKAN